MISNFVSAGNPVLFQPFDWMDPQTIMNYVGPSMPEGKKNLFKILWTGRVAGMAGNIMPAEKKNGDPSITALAKLRQKHRSKLLLNIMGTDIMQKSYGQNGVRGGIEDMMLSVKASADLSIAVISHSQQDVLEYLSEVSDMHLRLLMISDTLFLQSLVPATTLYSVVLGADRIALEPVV
jgi:hypothetical protein